MSEIYKRVCDSETEQVQIVMPEHINGYGRLFGGKLVEWIDVVAAVVARRHCNNEVTTVFIDNLHFKEAVYANNTLLLRGCITYVGNTSMEVKVDTFVEEIDGSRKLVNSAYFVMVALDGNEKPVRVPRLILETIEERAEWETGEKRSALRKIRAKEHY